MRFAHRHSEAPLEAPVEWEPAWLVLDAPLDTWSALRVTHNDLPLAVQLRKSRAGVAQIVCEWPRSTVGHHRLRAEGPAGVVERAVRVAPRKITPEALDALFEDLHERLPCEVALSLQRAGALTGVELRPPEASTLAGEVARIRRAIHGTTTRMGLTRLLPMLQRDPHRTLIDEAPWVHAFDARAPHPARLARALVRPENLDAERRLLRVVDRRAVAAYDTYENRLVRTFVDTVHTRARRLVRTCAALAKSDLANEAHAMVQDLDAARRETPFLDAVSALTVAPSRVTMVLQRRPAYRAALDGLLAFLRSSGARLDAPSLDAPLDNLPSLYELWGTLQVCVAVLDTAARLGLVVARQRLVRATRDSVLVRVLPDGLPAVSLEGPSGLRVELIPQRKYRREGALRSVSFTQEPDVAVEVHGHEGAAVWLFDPKYKLASDEGDAPGDGSPQKTDIDKMHAYSDAIRDAAGRRVVRYAATLYPGPDRHYGGGIAALRAWPGEGAALRARVTAILAQAFEAQGA